MNILSFKKLVRQNTGTSFLDSGGDNGRHWQRPLPEGRIINVEARKWTSHEGKTYCEVSASINLYEWLEAHLEIDIRLTKKLQALDAEKDLTIFDVAAEIEAITGTPVRLEAAYTYNEENDLSQDFQYAVCAHKEEWYYDSDAIVIIQSHNGADARGGFSTYIVARPTASYDALINFLNYRVGWCALSGTDADGNELTREQLQSLDEHWQAGYSSNPTYQLNKCVVDIVNQDHEKITVKLDTGETITVYPDAQFDS